MATWTVQVTISTTRPVDTATVTALLAGAAGCRDVLCGRGAPGVSVLLDVAAPTGSGAYRKAMAVVVAQVLPRLEGATLTDVHLSPGAPPVAATQSSASAASATGGGATTLT